MNKRTQYIGRDLAGFKLLDGANTGKIFFVEFIKKDGSIRRMTARRSVKKGVNGKGMAFRPLGKGFMTAYDMDKGGFRMINLLKVTRFSVAGEKYLVI